MAVRDTQTCYEGRHGECPGMLMFYDEPCECPCHVMPSSAASSADSSDDTLHNPKPESDILAYIVRELVAKGYSPERAAELAPWELHVRMGGD
jgi:hypothetical protein